MIVRVNNGVFNPSNPRAVNINSNPALNLLINKNPLANNIPIGSNFNTNNFPQLGMPDNQAQRNLFMNNNYGNNQQFNNNINNLNNANYPVNQIQNGYHFKQMDFNNPMNSFAEPNKNNGGNLRGSLNNNADSNNLGLTNMASQMQNNFGNMQANTQVYLFKFPKIFYQLYIFILFLSYYDNFNFLIYF